MPRCLGIAICIALLWGTPGLAAKRGHDDLKRYCTGDATSFCGGVDPDTKAMDDCFEKHRKELSENCRRAIDAYQVKGGK